MLLHWLKPMIAWIAFPGLGVCVRRCAITTAAGALFAVTLSIGDNVQAAQKPKAAIFQKAATFQKAALFQDKTAALLKRGYVELSGEDAASFLVGNSVVIKKTDTPKGLPAYANDVRYYFNDRSTAYECAANDCWTTFWKVDGDEICFEFPESCDDATKRLYMAPRLFRAPGADEQTGRIGVYLTNKSIIHAVIRGNATIAPLIDANGVGKMIEANAADFSQDIEAASKFSGGDKKVPVKGNSAISFLIGNTFISGETATDEHGGVHLCPVQGYYYAPDGRIITFNCFHWPDSWGMHITHWKLASGRLCIEDLCGNGKFGCGDRFERVYLAPSDKRDAWFVIAEDFPRKIFGYTGNIFHFK
jgi:hypothetical protein